MRRWRRRDKLHEERIGRLSIGFSGFATYSVLQKCSKLFENGFPSRTQPRGNDHECPNSGTSRETNSPWLMIPPVNDKSVGWTAAARAIGGGLPAYICWRKKIRTLSALANEPFILVPRHLEPGYYDQCISLFQQASAQGCSKAKARTNDSRFNFSRYGSFFSTCLNSYICRAGVVYKSQHLPRWI